jgi:hypothetical protein
MLELLQMTTPLNEEYMVASKWACKVVQVSGREIVLRKCHHVFVMSDPYFGCAAKMF